VLAMIEINLLPGEYRPREKTNVPLMLTVAVGMLVVGFIIMWGIQLNRELGAEITLNAELTTEKTALEDDVKKVKALKNKIARQKARQDTIIQISQSKVMWSLKLQQLAQIMEKFPNFWVKTMTLSKSRGGADLKLQLSATGSNLREVARFRDALKADPNFAYHFGELQGYQVSIVDLEPGLNFAEKMDLALTLPLKTSGDTKKRRR
jgi:Tfp pilus assembly protein PilN